MGQLGQTSAPREISRDPLLPGGLGPLWAGRD